MKTISALAAALLVAPALTAPASPATEAKDGWVSPSQIITARSIGLARLGMSVATLRRTFANSTVKLMEGPVSYYSLTRSGGEILRFATRSMNRPLRQSDRVASMWTLDPRFRLSSVVRPGTPLKDAARIYGRPTLSFWSHGEEAAFPRLGKKMIFEVSAPPNPRSEYKVAGIYTKSQLESLNGTTTRYRTGTKIVSIGCKE